MSGHGFTVEFASGARKRVYFGLSAHQPYNLGSRQRDDAEHEMGHRVSRSKRLCVVANAAPLVWEPPYGGHPVTLQQIQLVQPLVLPLLFADIRAYHRLVPAHR